MLPIMNNMDRNRHWILLACLLFSSFALLRTLMLPNMDTALVTNTPGIMSRQSVSEQIEAEVQRRLMDEVSKINKDLLLTRPDNIFPPIKTILGRDKKRILVTGGAGFVGSHLVDRLMEQGHMVTVVDNMFTGRRRNVQQWIGHPNFKLVEHDVVEPIMLEVDQIYHLASPASPPHYQYNPIKTIKTNTVGTINMLGLAKRVRARMLLTSTSEIYGDPEVHPQVESYWGNVNTIGPRACYDEAKRVAETMMYAYEKEGYVDVRVARIFNTFGPRMHPNDGRVVSNFIIQALMGKTITVYGSGKQTRSFQYVNDLVDGLMKLMNGNFSQPVNLGNPEEYSINDFAELIRKEVGAGVEISHLPATTDDPNRRKPDISRAKREIGWEPKFTVHEGLKRTIEYFKKEMIEMGEIEVTGPAE